MIKGKLESDKIKGNKKKLMKPTKAYGPVPFETSHPLRLELNEVAC